MIVGLNIVCFMEQLEKKCFLIVKYYVVGYIIVIEGLLRMEFDSDGMVFECLS
jgi:hypothetical protein